MTTDTDALSELCATERDTEVPPPDAVDAGWTRLEAALWPGGGGGDPSSDPSAGSGGAPGPASAPASAAATMSAGTKIAAALALTTAVGVGAVLWSSDDAPHSEPAIAAAPRDAPPTAIERDEAPRLRVADPEPPQVATPEPAPAPAIEPAPGASDADAPTGDAHAGKASPASRRPATALPDVPGEGLAHEVAILREASAALAAGKPSTALRWVRRHAADHPTGSLTEERLATEAIARCQLHDRRAAAVAEAFLEQHPRSTHEGRVRAACETMLSR